MSKDDSKAGFKQIVASGELQKWQADLVLDHNCTILNGLLATTLGVVLSSTTILFKAFFDEFCNPLCLKTTITNSKDDCKVSF